VATRRTEAALRDAPPVVRRPGMEFAVRAGVVEILAGALLELLVAPPPRPSPDEAQPSRSVPKSAVFRHIRGPL
jgi:hypothetical protein